MRTLAGLGVCLAVVLSPALAQERITQADLLRRVIDVQRLTTPPPAGERTALFSSHDRRSATGADGQRLAAEARQNFGQFLRKDDDGWDVMAELPGPGAITRIASGRPQGDIRFVLDGAVAIDTTFESLLSGQLPPFDEPLVRSGLTCHFPIGFNQSCKVVCRNSQAYYEIDTVQFPPGTQVETFKLALDPAAQEALSEVKKALAEGLTDKQLFGNRRTMPVAAQQDVAPGEPLTQTLEKAGTVRALYVALTDKNNPHDLYVLHHCLLRIYVDGEKTPSVEAPLVDFFGSGFELVADNSLVLGTDKDLAVPLPDRRAGEDRFMYCLFPMPYRNGLRIEIANLNEGKRKLGLLLHLRVDTQPPAADALRFCAGFCKEDPCKTPYHTLLEATGRGRIVGCVLNVDCPRAAWWGTGGENVWIDGTKSPTYVGTGTAGYFGDADELHPHIGPLEGVTRTGPYGKSSAYRWHIADCIDFQKSIRFAVENLQERGLKDTYYSSVVYWYAEPGAARPFKPLTVADVTPAGLRIPGAIEIEGHVSKAESISVVKEKYAGGAELSGREAVLISTDQPVSVTIPSDTEQTVRLKLRVNPRRAFETITVTAGETRIGTVTYDRTSDGLYAVGEIHLQKGDNTVTVECPRPAMLDCWILEPVPATP